MSATELPPAVVDESQVPDYTLPALLRGEDGTPITAPEAWPRRRRELLGLFESQVYGRVPAGAVETACRWDERAAPALQGAAQRWQGRLRVGPTGRAPAAQLLMYLPTSRQGPTPVFVGLNFHGNHTVQGDPVIELHEGWAAGERLARGAMAHRWPIPRIIERGYGVLTACCNDWDPDFDDGYRNGLHALWGEPEPPEKRGDDAPPDCPPDCPPDAPGAIAAWAFGLSRMGDVLRTIPAVDAQRIVAVGHSRLGKAALWAGAQDERFAMVVSNNSGCGGAAISRRRFGETLLHINTRFPHWFCPRFKDYNNREEALPIDQHMLLALVAPRLLYVASASGDAWADPKGEFIATVEAGAAYRLLGCGGLEDAAMPQPGHASHGRRVGYHLREGKHDVLAFDWERWMDFADARLRCSE